MACPRAWRALCELWGHSWGGSCGGCAQDCLDPSRAHSCCPSSSSVLSLSALRSSTTSCQQSHRQEIGSDGVTDTVEK